MSSAKKRRRIEGPDVAHDDVSMSDGGSNKSDPNTEQQQRGDANLAELEAQDLNDLKYFADKATTVEFDDTTGLPLRSEILKEIRGLVKVSNVPPPLQSDLKHLHQIVKSKVPKDDMVPWAGVGADTTRLRSFGFLGPDALNKLKQSDVKLHAQEKTGKEAKEDEKANWKAVCVLDPTNEELVVGEDGTTTINPTKVVTDFVECIDPSRANLDPKVVSPAQLIAYQTNLHNGAEHLAAHLDMPLFEGFGKVITTYGVTGSATILLIGKDEVASGEGGDAVQPSWKFRLNPGEAYILSGKARNLCLHAVLADEDGKGMRESLNLRFGLHTKKEAEEEIYQHWSEL